MSVENIKTVESVKHWIEDAGYNSPKRSQEVEHLLNELSDFCDFTEKDPDELVESCLRTTKSGDISISAKGRREIDDTIDEFVKSKGLSGHNAIVVGNNIRGFLIHNGVFMQGKVSL